MKQLIILVLLCIPLLSNSQIENKKDSIIIDKKEFPDTLRISVQSSLSEMIQLNEESKKLNDRKNKKLNELIELLNKKIKEDAVNKEF